MTEKEQALIQLIMEQSQQMEHMRGQITAGTLMLSTIYQKLPESLKNEISSSLASAFRNTLPESTEHFQSIVRGELCLLCDDLKDKLLAS